jgi:NADPH:quinone reductase-like Zn-dependent oxidoreductase
MEELPTTMRALVAPKRCKPAEYEVMNWPVPTIQNPDEMLIKVHAAGFKTGDTLLAAGNLNILAKLE